MNAIKLNTRKPHTENSLGSLFDSFFKPDFFGGIDPYHRSPFKKPPVNIIESDNSFKLDFSVPGWKKEDIKSFEQNIFIRHHFRIYFRCNLASL